MKVSVDYTKCAGIGMCEIAAPAVFEVGEDGQARVLKTDLTDSDMSVVEEAVTNCPAAALAIEE